MLAGQAINVERLATHQGGKAFDPGLYVTSQEATARYFSSIYENGIGGGPAVVKLVVPAREFREFAAARGIYIEALVRQPPVPGQTETFIPMIDLKDFNKIPGLQIVPLGGSP
jgi:hypothetical protein